IASSAPPPPAPVIAARVPAPTNAMAVPPPAPPNVAAPPVAAPAPPPEPTPAPASDAPPAGAQPKGAHLHDGFYFRGAPGAGMIASGSSTPPGNGAPDVGISGAGPSVDLAFGATVYRGLVVGGGIFGTSVPSPSYSAFGASASGGAAVVSSLGPFADWYFDPTQGFHALAGVGYAVISAAKGSPATVNGQSVPYPA